MIRISEGSGKFLIVNADDYGYYGCVSRGIADAANQGVVTATAIMANSRGLEEPASKLREIGSIDAGVHLNLTHGVPLTDNFRRRFESHDGEFPGKFWWVRRVLFSRELISDITVEWRAQIERCRELGIDLMFLNSHEHVHMLPGLLLVVNRLAVEHCMRYVRYTIPDWFYSSGLSGAFRKALVQVLCVASRSAQLDYKQPRMFGLSASGNLDQSYIDWMLEQLEEGEVAELMCHPGYNCAGEVADPRLLSYHNWDKEMQVLCSDGFMDSLKSANVSLIGYRDLPIQ